MKKVLTLLLVLSFFASLAVADTVLEPYNYSENFEERDLGAWASYPHWQDIAYDPNVRPNEIIPGDPNISFQQLVIPYTNVDNYAGAQKLFDAWLIPGSSVSLRYYLKTNLPVEFIKIRLAAGPDGAVDVTVATPQTNRWEWVTVTFSDFVRENICLAGNDRIKVNALAILAKIPSADPSMPIYLGLDDITMKAARDMAFKFAEPAVYKLSEWKQYIPKKHYNSDDMFNLSGRWPLSAKQVTLEVVSYTHPDKDIYSARLAKKGDMWSLKPLKLNWTNGMYLGKLTALDGSEVLSETEFTIHVAPKNTGGVHPRLIFDEAGKEKIIAKLNTDRFKAFSESITKNAKSQRDRIPVESLVFDLDQFPDEKWLATWSQWGRHIYHTDTAIRWNALAYSLHGDREAGEYAKDVLLKLSSWPNWTHPWQTKRGRFSEHRTGGWSHRVALAYDLTYELMSEDERLMIRKAIMKNIVGGAFRTYVEDDNITGKTSNWLAMVCGGSLMNMAAMFGDGSDVEIIEPQFTGTLLKLYTFINRVTDSTYGAWGEGFGYNNYSFTNISYSAPSLINVFGIDVTDPLQGTYKEAIWAGPVKEKKYFQFGDSGNYLRADNWGFLLNKYKDPLLGWFYNFVKRRDGLWDLVYDIDNTPQKNPFDENPVKVFKEVGTTVFKSGWEKDDFIFVMRTGAFYNHQHLDQGTFYLQDRGSLFFDDPYVSDYYDDQFYQSRFTQPVGHSTILIDGNHQSQRAGDHAKFAKGFEDHAFISHFLDGKNAAFSCGDIGRLYWGKVKCLRRNVLYLKPRTVLMLDTAIPGDRDVDVSLLYHNVSLKDINAGESKSTVSMDGNVLHVMHLAPEKITAEAVETPHYLDTLLGEGPLVKEGMLTVTARTKGNPLVMANLLTSTTGGEPDVTTKTGDGFVTGTTSGKNFALTTKPGSRYETSGIKTDALAITWSGDVVFAAMCTYLKRNGELVFESDKPVTLEIGDSIKYYHCEAGEVSIGAPSKPTNITVNGSKVDGRFDNEKKAVILNLPAGEGVIAF